ncbi:hypothetical protein JG687_00010422 [Phytophthora cactorum]|nr:hypothetical protein PC113_g7566 [Phytophthora cactorum]KAG3178228.1 hypothetical protein C6341_g8090 [Phytophthora cactorum]KAG6956730.1 hypothetical protein JG687_00010422 [Phytophthora cactorum]RAW39399.1 hypothetical protein PC110_g4371 [Phytophthora cactorum]
MQSQERPRRSHVQAQCPVRPVPTALVVSDARVLLASMELRKLCVRSSAQLHVLKVFIARKELPHRSNVALQMCIVLLARSTQFRYLKDTVLSPRALLLERDGMINARLNQESLHGEGRAIRVLRGLTDLKRWRQDRLVPVRVLQDTTVLQEVRLQLNMNVALQLCIVLWVLLSHGKFLRDTTRRYKFMRSFQMEAKLLVANQESIETIQQPSAPSWT